jgi:hypothetical protein
MGGSTSVRVTLPQVGVPGVYGTLGTPAAGNTPGDRESASSWTDHSGNLWLSGGNGFDAGVNMGDLSDLWKYQPPATASSLTISSATLPSGTTGVAYSQTFTAAGGTGNVTYAVTAGSLPPGLTLTSAGVLAGTPQAPTGSYSFALIATDSDGCTVTTGFAIAVHNALTVVPAALPEGYVGAPYSSSFTASGGTAPFTYGAIGTPPGLSLNTQTGTLTGTPTQAGNYTIFVVATDATGVEGTIQASLTVAAPLLVSDTEIIGIADSVEIHVTAPAYSLTATPSSLTMEAGQTAYVLITLTPVGGFTGSIALSCKNVPAYVRCTFSPTTLTANGSNRVQTARLTVTTNGPFSGSISNNGIGGMNVTAASFCLLPALILGGWLGWRRRRLPGEWKTLLLLAGAAFVLVVPIGCGISTAETPSGTCTLTITATASGTGAAYTGPASQSIDLTVTIRN